MMFRSFKNLRNFNEYKKQIGTNIYNYITVGVSNIFDKKKLQNYSKKNKIFLCVV